MADKSFMDAAKAVGQILSLGSGGATSLAKDSALWALGEIKKGYDTGMKKKRKRGNVPTTTKRKKPKLKLVCKHADKIVKGGSLSKRLSRLEELTDNLLGTLIYKKRQVISINTNTKQSDLDEVVIFSKTELETALAQLRYYNPSAPTTLITADFSSGTFGREVRVRSIKSTLRLRNNCKVPAYVTMYLCVAKEDTNTTPKTSVSNGLADVGGVTLTSALTYPSDSPHFRDLWDVVKVKKVYLDCADAEMRTVRGCYIYDASYVDSHNLEYIRDHGCFWLMRVEGGPSHDPTTTTNVSCSATGIDAIVDYTYVIDYNAGADITYIYHSDNQTGTGSTQSVRRVENQQCQRTDGE